MDPFHVVSLAGDKLDQCRRRIQRAITGRRGRAGDRLYRARRTLHTGADLLTDTQARRLEALFADDRHAVVQASWGVYQRLIQAYLSCTGWGGLCFRVGFFVGILGVGWSFRGTKAAVGSGG